MLRNEKVQKLKNLIKELVEDELSEMTVSADAGGYSTPMAFSATRKETEEKKKKKSGFDSLPGYTLSKEDISEATRYQNFKKSDARNSAKISLALREAKRILRDVDFLINISERLKSEENVQPSQFWKRTAYDINVINERIKNISKKIRVINK